MNKPFFSTNLLSTLTGCNKFFPCNQLIRQGKNHMKLKACELPAGIINHFTVKFKSIKIFLNHSTNKLCNK